MRNVITKASRLAEAFPLIPLPGNLDILANAGREPFERTSDGRPHIIVHPLEEDTVGRRSSAPIG